MSPSQVLASLTSIFPEFGTYWNSADNLFREEDGSFTHCGVFAEFSHFVRERFTSLSPVQLDALGHFVEACMQHQPSDLDTAVATCFLENVTSEIFTPALASHLGSRAVGFLSHD